MQKTLIMTIIIDDVELAHIDDLAEEVKEIFSAYEFQRIDINLSDTTMVKPIIPR